LLLGIFNPVASEKRIPNDDRQRVFAFITAKAVDPTDFQPGYFTSLF